MEDKFATFDAAYVLGALSPADRHAFEEHLAGCPSCAESVAELAGMPGLLARVPLAEILDDTPPEPVPPTLLPGLLDEVGRRRRRRRWISGGTAFAAAACLILLLIVVIVPGSGGGGTTPKTGTAMTAVVPAPIHATVSIQNVGWGSKITVHCGYELGNYGPRKYMLTVTGKGQHRPDQVASWMIRPGKDAILQGSSALHSSDISMVAITNASGKPLLQLNP
jgi:hypothetical protein